MTRHVSVRDARLHLSQIIDDVLRGEEIFIDRSGQAIAKLTVVEEEAGTQEVEVLAEVVRTGRQLPAEDDIESSESLDEFIRHNWY